MYQREHFFRLVKNGLEVVFSLISENQNAETLQFDLFKCERIKIEYTSPSFVGVKTLTTQKYGGNYYEIVGENKIKIVLSNLHNAPYLLNGVAFYGSYTLSICSLQIDVPSNVSQGTQDLGEITQVVVKSFEIGGGGGGGFTPTEAQQQAMDSGITSEILGDIETDIDNLKENLANFVGNFNSHADLLDYEGTLTNNDYAVVANDETHSNECWRYVYNADSDVWVAQYKINETPINTIDQTSNPTDTDSLSDLNGTTNKRWTLLKVWEYIKGKITEVYYPVGTVIFNTGTNPSTNFGGTWELYGNGTKALYLDETAGTNIAEELPNITGSIDLFSGNSGIASGSMGDGRGALSKTIKSSNYAYTGFDKYSAAPAGIKFDASKSSNIYKNNGKVRAEGITVCAWVRTA